MTDREKLVGLLDNIGVDDDWYTNTEIADHLLSNGVTVRKTGRWIIHSNGRGNHATNWAECSECRVCGSPQWKVCPVCEAKMDPIQIPMNNFDPDDLMGEYEEENQ